jgi:hypothetical protein
LVPAANANAELFGEGCGKIVAGNRRDGFDASEDLSMEVPLIEIAMHVAGGEHDSFSDWGPGSIKQVQDGTDAAAASQLAIRVA